MVFFAALGAGMFVFDASGFLSSFAVTETLFASGAFGGAGDVWFASAGVFSESLRGVVIEAPGTGTAETGAGLVRWVETK